MKTTKIVITGGPCAGKTTGLSYLEQELTKMGYKVVFVNETATEIMTNGLAPNSCVNNYEFEKAILQLQLMNERLYTNFCENLPDEKVLLVCDRGAMDCKSYSSEVDFARILADLNLSEVELRDNYDAVFHLVTAAKGAPQFYTTNNNNARRENIEQAIQMDERTMSAWVGHPHFRAIDNSTNFETKMHRLVKEICLFLGLPVPLEIERKYLIERPDENMLARLTKCKKVDIVQTYLQSSDNEERRVRQRGVDGSYIFTLTVKKMLSNLTRIETEKRITEREYLNLLNKTDTSLHQVKKSRYCVMENNRYYEIDIYPFSKKSAICEIELNDENEQINLPPYIKLKREVTDDKRFSNHSIAKEIPPELLD